ncbi:MAG: response regulator [Alistipes sp.]|nr:response regulator [Alistipes sp.]
MIDSSNYIITSTFHAYKYSVVSDVVTNLSVQQGLDQQNNDIICALKDRQGNIWLGTFEQGILKINSTQRTFNTPSAAITSLNSEAITACCSDTRFHRLWFGSKYSGLYIRNANGTIRHLDHTNHPALGSIERAQVRALFCDAQDRIWIGIGRTLIVGKLTESGFTELVTLKNFSPVSAINQDYAGNVWVGSYAGLYFFGRKITDPPTQITRKGPVTAILPERNNQLIYAEYGQNIFITENKTFESKPLIPEQLMTDTLSLNACVDLWRTKDGNLWIGSYTKGLLRYDPINRKFTQYLQNQGLPSNDVLAILEDQNGMLWMSTSNGIARFDPKSEQFRNFNETDGLINTQFFEKSIGADEEGTLYIGGNAGVECFQPNNIRPNSFHPLGILEDIKVMNRSVLSDPKNPQPDAIPYAQRITLLHRQNSFSIDYTGIDYNDADKLRYSYKLDGYDKEWIEAGSNKKASYANLPAGEYRFRLRVQNGDGVWSPESALDITVKPSPWQTLWAYLIYCGLIVAAIYFGTRFYIRIQYDRKARELAEQQHAHDLAVNQQKIDFYGNISHELRTPLTLINGNIELLAQSTKTGSSEQKLISMLSYNSNRLLRLLNQLLDLSRMGHDSIPLQVTLTDIVPIIRNVANSFRFNAQSREIDYSLHLEQDPLRIYTDEDVLEKILTNLISNAIKYTPRHGRITIEVMSLHGPLAAKAYGDLLTPTFEYMEFRITNSGRILDPEQLKHMFERFGRLEEEQIHGTGIGLHYTRTLVLRQHGAIRATSSSIEGGVTMSFVIPTEQRAFAPQELVNREEIQDEQIYVSADIPPMNFENPDTPVVQLPTQKESTILVVEDDPQIHTLLNNMLRNQYNILHAYNGREGFDMLREKMPEMVISDIRMPEMDGIVLCKSIKSDPQLSHIAVILLTAKTRIEERIEGYNCGADAYINKPFRADHLLSIIHSQMENRHRLKNYFNDQNQSRSSEEEELAQITNSLSEMDQRFMEKLHSFIDKSIENPDININVMAVELGFSRTSFYRKMKSLTGLAPNDYVRNFKMKKAAKLILEGNLSIAEISDQTGFGTQSHFSTAFKKYFGVSPKDYKEKWKEDHKNSRSVKELTPDDPWKTKTI